MSSADSTNSNSKKRSTISKLVAKSDDGAAADGNYANREKVTPLTNKDHRFAAITGKLRDANMLVRGSVLGAGFIDEYRRVKRPLLSNAFGKTASLVERGNLILVTSSVPGEGKTHSAMNLALSISQERDKTVLLVDCDAARQGCSRMLGLQDRPGLMDVLLDDKLTVGDVMLSTDIEGLRFVSAGKRDDFVAELLASRRMAEVVDEIVERYDDRIIIFDGPPLLATPQTQILSTLVGQVVFVIEASKTPQAVVEQALDMIPEEQAVSAMLNKSEGVIGGAYYYYDYYGPYQ